MRTSGTKEGGQGYGSKSASDNVTSLEDETDPSDDEIPAPQFYRGRNDVGFV